MTVSRLGMTVSAGPALRLRQAQHDGKQAQHGGINEQSMAVSTSCRTV
ncbi:MAG: hypothetical protein HRF45_13475 [Fimbriimonadia bacterium]